MLYPRYIISNNIQYGNTGPHIAVLYNRAYAINEFVTIKFYCTQNLIDLLPFEKKVLTAKQNEIVATPYKSRNTKTTEGDEYPTTEP